MPCARSGGSTVRATPSPWLSSAARTRSLSARFRCGFHRIFARCGADNQRSAKLMKALGMRLEAHYREHALFQGDWDEELHFAILDREWRRGTKVKEISRHMVA